MARGDRPVGDLMNLGPVTAGLLREVGIETERQLREVGALAAYGRLKHLAPRRITTVCLYALQGALTNTRWNAIPISTREALRRLAAAKPHD